jgi:membrane protein
VFLFWIYLSWLVTLLGAEFTYCLGIYRDVWRPDRGAAGNDLLLAYRLLGYLWEGQREGIGLPMDQLLDLEPGHAEAELELLLMQLEKSRLVLRTERGEWMLARDLHQVSLLELFRAGPFLLPRTEANSSPELESVLAGLQAGLEQSLDLPLADLYGKRSTWRGDQAATDVSPVGYEN